MPKTITLRMFVTQAGSNSSQPDDSTTNLRLNLTPKSDKVDDANVEAFPNQTKKNGILELNGLADGAVDGVKAGRRAKVTIEFE